MNSLAALWYLSLALAGISLLIMAALLVARSFSGFLEKRREAERKRLVPMLLGQSDTAVSEPRSRLGRKLLTGLSVELIHLVRGADREHFVANATAMGVPERLRKQLERGTPRARLAAAEALAQFADAQTLQSLGSALKDRSPDVRIAAALSLAAAGTPPPANDLVYQLGVGTSERSLIASSLFRDVAERRPDEIRALLVDENVPAGAKAALIESVSASSDYTLVPLVVSLAGEEDNPANLKRYLRALGAFGHPAAEPALRRGLQNADWEVRAAAAEAAGRIGLSSLAANLAQLLGDGEWWVRFHAGQALAKLGGDGANQLREAAASGAEPARTAALQCMAERGVK